MGPDEHARIQKVMSEGSNSTFFVNKGGERIQLPLKKGVIIGPLAKRHLNGVSPADR